MFGTVSTCSTGTDSRHGEISSTGSNPAVTIRSAEASSSQITRCPAMSSVPAYHGLSSAITPLAIAPITTGSPACAASSASTAVAPLRTAPAPASSTGRLAARSTRSGSVTEEFEARPGRGKRRKLDVALGSRPALPERVHGDGQVHCPRPFRRRGAQGAAQHRVRRRRRQAAR